MPLMTPVLKVALRASEALRKTSRLFPWLRYVADSVYAESIRVEMAVCPPGR